MSNNIILIDGGMGQELIHRSKVNPDGLWSARVMMDNFDLVVDLHKDFINVIGFSTCSNTWCAVTISNFSLISLRF